MKPLPPELVSPYQGYAYSYPHKTAYRTITPPRSLRDVWSHEPKERRYLYVHIPFCEMRCGFCNLFTIANPDGDLEHQFINALKREAEAVAEASDGSAPAQLALGGGTPTYLGPRQIDQVFEIANQSFGTITGPVSVETSPKTATPDRLAILRDRGVQRISIGVQSLVDAETRAMGRPQRRQDVEHALDRIRDLAFPNLNVDLIYGANGQTPDSWTNSLERVLHWHPEEIYLYPLYVRPKTGLDGRRDVWDQQRLQLYRIGCDLLASKGYQQISMRHFRRADAPKIGADEYSCQEDGMIGLGPGARSYTRKLHYSTAFAVTRGAVLSLLRAYLGKSAAEMATAANGIELTNQDQQRRFLLKSLLRCEGLDRVRFQALYGIDPMQAFPEIHMLAVYGLVEVASHRITPTSAGLERSDAIGPWLYAPQVTRRMHTFETI